MRQPIKIGISTVEHAKNTNNKRRKSEDGEIFQTCDSPVFFNDDYYGRVYRAGAAEGAEVQGLTEPALPATERHPD